MNILFFLQNTVKLFSHLRTPQLDAELLLSYVLQQSRTWIKVFDNTKLSHEQIIILNKLVQRRIANEPIAYIIKKKEFWSLSLHISENVLIPRSSTEILVEQSLDRLSKRDKILDLGSGSGAISLAIAHTKLQCHVTGIDNSRTAISVSHHNAKCLNIHNVNFYQSNWFLSVRNKFNLIVSNPPYLSQKDMLYVEKDIFFEPSTALVAGKNGLLDIAHIIKHSKKYLLPQGWLLIEHGWKQKKMVIYLFKKYNFYNIVCYKDYQGYDRVVVGRML